VADWNEDSPQLRDSLTKILEEVARKANRRDTPRLATAKRWQSLLMHGLEVPSMSSFFDALPASVPAPVKLGLNFEANSW